MQIPVCQIESDLKASGKIILYFLLDNKNKSTKYFSFLKGLLILASKNHGCWPHRWNNYRLTEVRGMMKKTGFCYPSRLFIFGIKVFPSASGWIIWIFLNKKKRRKTKKAPSLITAFFCFKEHDSFLLQKGFLKAMIIFKLSERFQSFCLFKNTITFDGTYFRDQQ